MIDIWWVITLAMVFGFVIVIGVILRGFKGISQDVDWDATMKNQSGEIIYKKR